VDALVSLDGWQHSTIVAILDNPRYTGYAVYGRWQKVEELLDPEDVAAGYVVKFRRSPQAKIVRSRQPAHPAIVSVETFTTAQLEQRKRKSHGKAGCSAIDRRRVSKKRTYLYRGRIRCAICARTMEGAARRQDTIYYRCNARTLVPGSVMAIAHPSQIYLREDVITPRINRWIGSLFDPIHRDETISALLEADDSADRAREHLERMRDRVAAAETVMEKLRKALDAGWDPVELRDQYNAAVAEKRAAEAALGAAPDERGVSREDLEAYVDHLGDVAAALDGADPEELSELYSSLRLSLRYDLHINQTVDVEVDPLVDRVDKLRVRGGT